MAGKLKYKLDSVKVQELIDKHGGNLAQVAAELGIARTTLDNQIKRGFIKVDIESAREAGAKRKLSDQVAQAGSLEDRDLKNADQLLKDYDVNSDDYEIVKIDVSKRDGGTVSSPKIARSISVTVAPKGERLQPALKGEKIPPKSQRFL